MTGQVHWFPLLVLFLAISPVLAFWLYGRWAAKKYVIEETTVRCLAHDNQLMHVTLVRDRATGAPVGLRRCTAHNPVDVVRCNKACLPKFVHLHATAAGAEAHA